MISSYRQGMIIGSQDLLGTSIAEKKQRTGILARRPTWRVCFCMSRPVMKQALYHSYEGV